MRIVCIIVYYALSLIGCSPPGTVTDVRSDIDGSIFHGRVETREGVSHFECIDSATGTCHFFLRAAKCPPSTANAAACNAPTPDEVDVASGRTRDVPGLPDDIRVCLAVDASGRC